MHLITTHQKHQKKKKKERKKKVNYRHQRLHLLVDCLSNMKCSDNDYNNCLLLHKSYTRNDIGDEF